MDGENNGKPYEQMDDLGGKPTIFGNIQVLHRWKIYMEPENTGPPGEGKSSEPKHHFPAATLNFGGALGGRFK